MDVERLSALPLFADVAEADLQALAQAARERIVSEGEMIVREGDFGYTVFLIEEGAVEVIKDGEVVVSLGPGDIFGEVAVEQSGRRTADVRATAESRLIVILNRDLWRVEKRLPQIRETIKRTAHERALDDRIIGRSEIEQA